MLEILYFIKKYQGKNDECTIFRESIKGFEISFKATRFDNEYSFLDKKDLKCFK